jgi:hypothetical protein
LAHYQNDISCFSNWLLVELDNSVTNLQSRGLSRRSGRHIMNRYRLTAKIESSSKLQRWQFKKPQSLCVVHTGTLAHDRGRGTRPASSGAGAPDNLSIVVDEQS